MSELQRMEDIQLLTESTEMQAFRRLDAARTDIKQYLTRDFSPEKEQEKARTERYFKMIL